MESSRPRQTVASSAAFEGRGLHSGADVRVTVHPGESGIWFRSGAERIAARPENVTDTSRCTRLGSVATVEHLMSAFAGLGVTDAEVEVEGPEVPALDGAAACFVAGLRAAGLAGLPAGSVTLPFARVFHIEDRVKVAVGKGDGHWRFVFDTGDRWLGEQAFELIVTPEAYSAEVAPARTFAYEEELPAIRAAGLAQGLDAASAFAIGRTEYVGNVRFPDEPARHKLLDLLGDVYLAGVPIALLNGIGERSGHRTNVAAAAKLAAACPVSD